MKDEITRYLNQFDLDVRKSGDARFMDQKCTPDVVCFIADCIITAIDTAKEFTVADIWQSRYFINNCKAIFNKPLPTNPTAHSEYDKFIQQPLRMLAYAHVLEIEKRGNQNYYRVNNLDILDYIAQRERNTYNFLYCYLLKVLGDSGILRYFDEYRDKCQHGSATNADFADLKVRYERFIIGFTPINTAVEVRRIYAKVLNIYAAENHINGTEKGLMSKYATTFSDLMYNRKNWRDLNKDKSITRQDAATQDDIEQQEAYNAYYVQKAMNLLRKIQVESEVKDRMGVGEATQVHHIFPKSEFPQIAHYLENLIKLTAQQHCTLAHPKNNTKEVNRDYQLTCLLAKSDTIEKSLKKYGEKYYRKESFVRVINIGLKSDVRVNMSFGEIKEMLIQLYNAA